MYINDERDIVAIMLMTAYFKKVKGAFLDTTHVDSSTLIYSTKDGLDKLAVTWSDREWQIAYEVPGKDPLVSTSKNLTEALKSLSPTQGLARFLEREIKRLDDDDAWSLLKVEKGVSVDIFNTSMKTPEFDLTLSEPLYKLADDDMTAFEMALCYPEGGNHKLSFCSVERAAVKDLSGILVYAMSNSDQIEYYKNVFNLIVLTLTRDDLFFGMDVLQNEKLSLEWF